MVRLIAALVGSAGLLLGLVPIALASPPTFGTPTAKAVYGERVTFTQPVQLDEEIATAEFLVTFPGAIGPTVLEVAAPSGTGQKTLSYKLELADGHITPNTKLSGQWRLYPAATPDQPVTGPSVSVVYADDRFEWKTKSGDVVRVHWYEGSDEFGARALKVGEDAVQSASTLLGVTETEPIDFFVYADQNAFYDALGPGTRENVGGQENGDIRTMFALVRPTQIDDAWVGIVIPHELTHLVFDTAVRNPYHFPPRWLTEGLAVYQSQGYDAEDRTMIEQWAPSGELIPLSGLVGQFPTTSDRFSLAYAESVAAVDYLVRTYGQDALVSLIKSYASGLTDDEAFSQALGLDTTAFGDAWLASLDAVAPTRYGPQPAAPGPVPAAWAGHPAPGATAKPGIPAVMPPAAPGGLQAGDDGGSARSLVVAIVVVGVTVAAVLGLVGWRRRQDAADA
jgi:Peptidase MA superfamily